MISISVKSPNKPIPFDYSNCSLASFLPTDEELLNYYHHSPLDKNYIYTKSILLRMAKNTIFGLLTSYPGCILTGKESKCITVLDIFIESFNNNFVNWYYPGYKLKYGITTIDFIVNVCLNFENIE